MTVHNIHLSGTVQPKKWPATTVEERWTEVLGLRTYYRTAGENRKPLLFLHGGGSDYSGFSWKYAFETLAGYYRVFAPDLPGYGNSEAPPSGNPFPFHIQFIEAFLDTLGISKTHLAGISMGGGIALGFALSHPRRVEKLVLVDSYGLVNKVPGMLFTYLAGHLPAFNRFLRFLLRYQRWLIKMGLQWMVHNRGAVTTELVNDAWKSVRKNGLHPVWEAFLKHEIRPNHFRTDYRQQLQSLAAPTLILHGKNDRLFPVAQAEQAHQLIPRSRLYILEDCGHLPPLEKPAVFNRLLLDFLSNHR